MDTLQIELVSPDHGPQDGFCRRQPRQFFHLGDGVVGKNLAPKALVLDHVGLAGAALFQREKH